MRRLATVLLTTFVLFQTTPHSHAQSTNAPPYEADLMRLSEIMGALHFLRPLCGHPDDPSWRLQMENLLEAETVEGARQRRFVERFNQGYRGFASVYQSCSPSARIAMKHYVNEARELIKASSSRYGG